jgi:zinc protease
MKRNFRVAAFALGTAVLMPLFAADTLPKAETILDKTVDAMGGKAAYDKVHSMILTGSMEVKGIGVKGSLTSYHAAPDKLYVEIKIEGIGTIRDGSDGKIAWEVSALQGPRLKEGDEKAMALREADMNSAVNWRKYYKQAVTDGIEKVDGKDCYKITMTPAEGSPETRYIDKETYLPAKMAMTMKGPMGEIAMETSIGDFRKENGLLVPFKATQKAAGQEIAITFDSVQFNVDIPAEKFNTPEEIQALLNKK